eukprot:5572410-Amphidinium_carterae.2
MLLCWSGLTDPRSLGQQTFTAVSGFYRWRLRDVSPKAMTTTCVVQTECKVLNHKANHSACQ